MTILRRAVPADVNGHQSPAPQGRKDEVRSGSGDLQLRTLDLADATLLM